MQKLKNEQAALYKKTARDLPLTQIGVEGGQINSIYFDNRFSIQQQIEFPSVYVRSALALEKEYESLMHESDYRRALVMFEIRSLVYRIRIMRQQEVYLRESHALWDTQASKAKLREQSGETGLMEKMQTGSQQFELMYERERNRAELYAAEQSLMLLTGYTEIPDLSSLPLIASFSAQPDSMVEEQHPLLQSLQKQMEQSQWLEKKEQARRLPALGLSFSDMSMKGVGADDVRYGPSQRFRSAQLSIGIPIFNTAQKHRVGIAKKETERRRLERETERRKMMQRLGVLVRRYRELSQICLQEYEPMMAQTALMNDLAKQQFDAGSINMSEYLLLLRQSLNTRLQLLDMVSKLNQVIFEYQLLKNKP
jgi:cobalt-zinc-cadmium resistance protein CzcA